jgi:hypothetical protein
VSMLPDAFAQFGAGDAAPWLAHQQLEQH